jgi:hypothetical protein
MIRLFVLLGVAALSLLGCTPASFQNQTDITLQSQVTFIPIASSTPEPTETTRPLSPLEERFSPFALTLEDLPTGIRASSKGLVESVGQSIVTYAQFSESLAYGFESSGTDFLGGVTGFLDDELVTSQFDAELQEDVAEILAEFHEAMGAGEDVPLLEEDQQFVTEIPMQQMPAETAWATDFLRVDGNLVRIDVVAFRRGAVGVYLLYVSRPANQPLLDITAVTFLMEERLRLPDLDGEAF